MLLNNSIVNGVGEFYFWIGHWKEFQLKFACFDINNNNKLLAHRSQIVFLQVVN